MTGSLRKNIVLPANLIEKENLQTSVKKIDHFCEGLSAIRKNVIDNFYPQNKTPPNMKTTKRNIGGLLYKKLYFIYT